MLKNKRSYLIPVIGFFMIILIGAFLLYLPICNKDVITFKDALFTATSGLTTTGFSKVAIADQFNFVGQLIVAILMEIGALGFIIFISYFWGIKDKRLKISDMLVINDNISGDDYAKIKEHSIFIIKLMLRVQIIGAILLSIGFYSYTDDILKSIWFGIFHTISAFSNTGFDLFGSANLTMFADNYFIQIILILLMVIGSIGVFVIEDIMASLKRKNKYLKVQTKIILTYFIGLMIISTCVIKYFEPNISILNSLFLSISSRSTGFVIVNTSLLGIESKITLIISMFIGGGPASTSGGIKLTVLAITIATIISTLRGKNETILFWRKVPTSIIRRAFTIFSLYIFILLIMSMIFLHYNNIDLLAIVFDSVSAISNTGLSLIDYNSINIVGEIILILLMFIGRAGPLSMVMIFVNEDRKVKFIEYPEENIIL